MRQSSLHSKNSVTRGTLGEGVVDVLSAAVRGVAGRHFGSVFCSEDSFAHM